MYHPITSDELDEEIVKEDRLTVVMFGRDTCSPCRKAFPVYEQVSNYFKRNGINVEFFLVDTDTDDGKELLKRFDIGGVPCYLHFYNGDILFQGAGYTEAIDISDLIFSSLNRIYEGIGVLL